MLLQCLPNCYIINSRPEKLQRPLICKMPFNYAGVAFITSFFPSFSLSFLFPFKGEQVLNALEICQHFEVRSKLKYHLKLKHSAALKDLWNKGKSRKPWAEGLLKEQPQNGDISGNVPQPYFSWRGKNQLQNYFWHHSVRKTDQSTCSSWVGVFIFFLSFPGKAEACCTRKHFFE